ncbi:MAG: phosphoribosylamine--glycine ligase [Alphaproteobacteria bacterium]
MNILIVGGGGREHALAWAIAASPLCTKLYCAPGNAGIAQLAECVAIAADDIDALVRFAGANRIDFVVVGPEAPLVGGLVDRLEAAGIGAFGPGAEAARLEGSKGFMKDFCARHGIPSAAYARFALPKNAKAYIREHGAPIVVKADGLAAGKGVTVANTIEEAEAAVDAAMDSRDFGDAGAEIVIEECLRGEEVSVFALADGESYRLLASAQDHKPVGEGDTGPNTGGMGAYSPAPIATPALMDQIEREIIAPTVAGMAADGAPYHGVLFAGIMVTEDGPKLLEFNVRFGDPETQVLIMRLASDLLPALIAASEGGLATVDLRWRDDAALVVVMAAKGYPGAYAKGSEIRGVEAAGAFADAMVFHAGTRAENGRLLADGGRVLGVAGSGANVGEAQAAAYRALAAIDWDQGFCRRDIGWRAVSR